MRHRAERRLGELIRAAMTGPASRNAVDHQTDLRIGSTRLQPARQPLRLGDLRGVGGSARNEVQLGLLYRLWDQGLAAFAL